MVDSCWTTTRRRRALRKIAIGRKRWLFVGSNLHAQSAQPTSSPSLPQPGSRARARGVPARHHPRATSLAQRPVPRALSPKYWAATRVRDESCRARCRSGLPDSTLDDAVAPMELALARRGADVTSPKADTPPRLQILTPPAGRNTGSAHRIRTWGAPPSASAPGGLCKASRSD